LSKIKQNCNVVHVDLGRRKFQLIWGLEKKMCEKCCENEKRGSEKEKRERERTH
jgi:hypothetical protein